VRKIKEQNFISRFHKKILTLKRVKMIDYINDLITIPLTTCKSNSGFSGNFSGSASVLPRQIYRFDYLDMVVIWLLGCNELKPLLSATALAPARYGQLDEEINTDQSHRLNRKTLTKSQLTVSEEKSSKNGRNMPKRPKIRSRHLKFN
jgi:hypothetical protein